MAATKKIDYKRELRELYGPPRDPVLVEVPEMSFLMIDGQGDPNTAADFTHAIEALYTVAYTTKFAVKRSDPAADFSVMPLEGLFWTPDSATFEAGEKAGWAWTLMVMQPDSVTRETYEHSCEEAARKKSLEAIGRMRLERYAEGLSAQLMHVGPYAEEGPTIERLQAFIAEQGCEVSGRHHEIYLGDPRRTAPERLRTVIRMPVRRVG